MRHTQEIPDIQSISFKYQQVYDFFHQKYDLGEELRTSCFWTMNKHARIQQHLLLPEIGETFQSEAPDHHGIFT